MRSCCKYLKEDGLEQDGVCETLRGRGNAALEVYAWGIETAAPRCRQPRFTCGSGAGNRWRWP